MTLALHERRHSAKRRVELLLGLAQVQGGQRKRAEAEIERLQNMQSQPDRALLGQCTRKLGTAL